MYCNHFLVVHNNTLQSHESLKHKLDSYSYSLHMSSSKLLENTSKKLEKLAMLEQCGQIKAALESPAGCERVGNYAQSLQLGSAHIRNIT